ncbi:MAG: hypothetical protein COV67_15085 [Nitrospinae bacterium CG11_big_fil_rev_8_21_14_0_20_56_8]|nr:MAG: hypothetical protein COV67_15085 [Nitrospinae bacterium CG11_big_fil_rev_8_21_14_0_20_56_8]
MSSLKGILFSQFCTEGLNKLVEELQAKYKPKKGRRFNHDNITYEISRPVLKENLIEFAISSKIPQDELKNEKDMKSYFQDIKKLAGKEKNKAVSIEMENIVWGSRKDVEKERDYVKLVYHYPLDNLFDNEEIMKRFKEMSAGKIPQNLEKVASAFTPQGKLVLLMVQEKIQEIVRQHVEHLINANQQVRTTLKN